MHSEQQVRLEKVIRCRHRRQATEHKRQPKKKCLPRIAHSKRELFSARLGDREPRTMRPQLLELTIVLIILQFPFLFYSFTISLCVSVYGVDARGDDDLNPSQIPESQILSPIAHLFVHLHTFCIRRRRRCAACLNAIRLTNVIMFAMGTRARLYAVLRALWILEGAARFRLRSRLFSSQIAFSTSFQHSHQSQTHMPPTTTTKPTTSPTTQTNS